MVGQAPPYDSERGERRQAFGLREERGEQ